MIPTRVRWLCGFLLGALVVPAPAQTRLSPPPANTGRRPNVVVLLCDDLGYGDLGCYGNPTIRTPNLDLLAAQGLKLTSCYAGMPVCSPSRAALMTGRICQREGIGDWIPANSGVQLTREAVTVARLLQNSGYATAMMGKWHLNSKWDGSETTPGDHGFGHWLATQNNAAPNHLNPTNFIRNGKPAGALTGHASDVIVEEAVTWLRTLHEEKPNVPFFLYVPFHAPHEPVAAEERFVQLYPGLENDRAQYCATITQTDQAIGRLLGTLDALKLSQNTFVFFSSDNGPETLNRYRTANRSHGSPGPLRGMKLHLYEGGIRVPGLMRWPGVIKPGTSSEEPVSFLDLLPTLGALAGAKLPANRPLDGINLQPLLAGRSIARKQPLFWQYDRALGTMKFAVRSGDWKLLADAELQQVELYNLKTDVAERTELAASRPDLVSQLLPELKRLRREVAK